MGRWAQAERRGRAPDAGGTAVIGTPLVGADPGLFASWNALRNATFWEVEFWMSSSPESTLQGVNVPGGARRADSTLEVIGDEEYRAHVRGWTDGIAGPWSAEGVYLA